MTSQADVEVLWKWDRTWGLCGGHWSQDHWRGVRDWGDNKFSSQWQSNWHMKSHIVYPMPWNDGDPPAHFIYVWYRQYQLDTYETEWKSFKYCQTYVVQLEKSISQRCDTKCFHTNVVADPTIIECDEDVMLWGEMFDCNRVIIGLDLGVGDLFWKFIFSLNRASIQNSIQSKIQNIHSKNIHSIE